MLKPFICTALVLASSMAMAQDQGGDREAKRAEWQAKAEARFVEADKDRNGYIDRVEAQFLGERMVKHFDRIDANADGRLSREEMTEARQKVRRGGGKMRGHMAYQRGLFVGMDDDGDGAISRAELGNKMPRWSENFDAIDANADGKLSQEELRAWQSASREARRAERGA
jgi:Ca2+-binding EF-hand superfamily protein